MNPSMIISKFLLCLSITLIITFFSYSQEIYGVYNTRQSKDKTAFYQIKLKSDKTVEKIEIHTISDFAKGQFLVKGRKIVCYFDSSQNHFPRGTITFVLKGKRLYFVKNEIINKKSYLVKQ
jgi:hypothetical protein